MMIGVASTTRGGGTVDEAKVEAEAEAVDDNVTRMIGMVEGRM